MATLHISPIKHSKCDYCKKIGHTAKACFKKKKDETTKSTRTEARTVTADSDSHASDDEGEYELFSIYSSNPPVHLDVMEINWFNWIQELE